MDSDENAALLQKALRDSYKQGRVDGIEIVAYALRQVAESENIPLEHLAGFLVAVELAENTKGLLGLD